jgi:hypothetical protein
VFSLVVLGVKPFWISSSKEQFPNRRPWRTEVVVQVPVDPLLTFSFLAIEIMAHEMFVAQLCGGLHGGEVRLVQCFGAHPWHPVSQLSTLMAERWPLRALTCAAHLWIFQLLQHGVLQQLRPKCYSTRRVSCWLCLRASTRARW